MNAEEAKEFFQTFLDLMESHNEENVVLENDYCKASRAAITALEKQIPKKPIITKFDNGAEIINCGKCFLGSPIARGVDYCPHCGTKIDWEEEENK